MSEWSHSEEQERLFLDIDHIFCFHLAIFILSPEHEKQPNLYTIFRHQKKNANFTRFPKRPKCFKVFRKLNFKIWDMVLVLKIPRGFAWVSLCVKMYNKDCVFLVLSSYIWKENWLSTRIFGILIFYEDLCWIQFLFHYIVERHLLYPLEESQQLKWSTFEFYDFFFCF